MSFVDQERSFFDTNGYVVKPGLFGPDSIQRIKDEIEDLHDRMATDPTKGVGVSWEEFGDQNMPNLIRQLMHSELVSTTLNEMLRSDTMLDVVEALIGPDVSLYHSKLLMKAANDGSAIPWHQDYAYWKQDGNRPLMISCMVAIDAADLANGCTQFVAGSHKWGLQEHEREKTSFGVFLPGHYQERDDATPLEMEPGDAVFFNALVIHGSAPNGSGRARRINTFAYNVTGNGEGQCREWMRGKE
jgi:ectoine hydroxylase-related dioxygenase (phytanoyl-CoA dioxygenase family)